MARLTIEQKDERMPVTIQMIGTGITRQPVLTISGSLGEEPGPGITIYVDGPMLTWVSWPGNGHVSPCSMWTRATVAISRLKTSCTHIHRCQRPPR